MGDDVAVTIIATGFDESCPLEVPIQTVVVFKKNERHQQPVREETVIEQIQKR